MSLWEDPDFQPGASILPDDNPDENGYAVNDVVWLRPAEICKAQNWQPPQFIIASTTASDINQNKLGDCWFLCAVATLADSHTDMLKKVVPLDQTFDRNYTGKFKFNFWNFGQWTTVEVDDRLPTVNRTLVDGEWINGEQELIFVCNTKQPNEFWAPLLEKAYAKLKGGYQTIVGGNASNALVDMTGGFSETIELNQTKLGDVSKLWDVMEKLIGKRTLLSAATIANEGETDKDILECGIVCGHAYSVVQLKTMTVDGKVERLVHLRNPWGSGEWNGDWSDKSNLWDKVPPEVQEEMRHEDEDNGSFWMSFDEFLKYYSELNVCFLDPNAESVFKDGGRISSTWKVESVEGLFDGKHHKHQVSVGKADTVDGKKRHAPEKIHVIVSLMQQFKQSDYDENSTPLKYDLVQGGKVVQRGTTLPQHDFDREYTTHYDLHPQEYDVVVKSGRKNLKYLLRIYQEAAN